MLIRCHMGPYDKSFEDYKEAIEKTHPECILFHHIDHEVTARPRNAVVHSGRVRPAPLAHRREHREVTLAKVAEHQLERHSFRPPGAAAPR